MQVDIWQNVAVNPLTGANRSEDYNIVEAVERALDVDTGVHSISPNGVLFRFHVQGSVRLFQDDGDALQLIHDALTVAVARRL